jgi:hypothetical protein
MVDLLLKLIAREGDYNVVQGTVHRELINGEKCQRMNRVNCAVTEDMRLSFQLHRLTFYLGVLLVFMSFIGCLASLSFDAIQYCNLTVINRQNLA